MVGNQTSAVAKGASEPRVTAGDKRKHGCKIGARLCSSKDSLCYDCCFLFIDMIEIFNTNLK